MHAVFSNSAERHHFKWKTLVRNATGSPHRAGLILSKKKKKFEMQLYEPDSVVEAKPVVETSGERQRKQLRAYFSSLVSASFQETSAKNFHCYVVTIALFGQRLSVCRCYSMWADPETGKQYLFFLYYDNLGLRFESQYLGMTFWLPAMRYIEEFGRVRGRPEKMSALTH